MFFREDNRAAFQVFVNLNFIRFFVLWVQYYPRIFTNYREIHEFLYNHFKIRVNSCHSWIKISLKNNI